MSVPQQEAKLTRRLSRPPRQLRADPAAICRELRTTLLQSINPHRLSMLWQLTAQKTKCQTVCMPHLQPGNTSHN